MKTEKVILKRKSNPEEKYVGIQFQMLDEVMDALEVFLDPYEVKVSGEGNRLRLDKKKTETHEFCEPGDYVVVDPKGYVLTIQRHSVEALYNIEPYVEPPKVNGMYNDIFCMIDGKNPEEATKNVYAWHNEQITAWAGKIKVPFEPAERKPDLKTFSVSMIFRKMTINNGNIKEDLALCVETVTCENKHEAFGYAYEANTRSKYKEYNLALQITVEIPKAKFLEAYGEEKV